MEVGESQDETALENAVDDSIQQQQPHTESIQLPKSFYVIPVLFMEFLALALTRAVIPPLLLYVYGNHVYVVMGTSSYILHFYLQNHTAHKYEWHFRFNGMCTRDLIFFILSTLWKDFRCHG